MTLEDLVRHLLGIQRILPSVPQAPSGGEKELTNPASSTAHQCAHEGDVHHVLYVAAAVQRYNDSCLLEVHIGQYRIHDLNSRTLQVFLASDFSSLFTSQQSSSQLFS